MDTRTAEILWKLNNGFYRDCGASFSATRRAPWPGWERCLAAMEDAGDGTGGGPGSLSRRAADCGLSAFDLACGNLRFAAFLGSAFPGADIAFYAVDNCDSLAGFGAAAGCAPGGSVLAGGEVAAFPTAPAADESAPIGGPPASPADRGSAPPGSPPGGSPPAGVSVSYQSLDVLGTLLQGLRIGDKVEAPACDLSVSFGFMHHVPLPVWREEVLASLVAQTRPGGFVAVSLWQFLNDAALREKARHSHERALAEGGLRELDGRLDGNDRLLGWKGIPGTYRYCHSFSEPEIDRLVESVAGRASLASRFTSDGRTKHLNTYLVLKVL
ncbi:MAG: hypothetical protein FWG23_00270 [Eggerthellaceae bacterium]|jgi:SAM-dependent methyltransferase|nr:hypothetical protein [Eggerthellaceae bacterium]MDR2715272.1 hypothetical protein [Coriobacteriaceae bacterium]